MKQIAKFVVLPWEKVPTDVEEGMRVGVDRTKYASTPCHRIDPLLPVMTVEEKPDVTYDDVGGARGDPAVTGSR